MDLDHDSPAHVYEQIADELRSRIAEGTYTRRLPSINDLKAEFGVSVDTARRALQELVKDGTAVVARGRGFYVAKREQ